MANRLSPNNSCCGCSIFAADFSQSLVDSVPVAPEYYYNGDRIGIAEGNPGYGLAFAMKASRDEWEQTVQYVVPTFETHPDPAPIAAMLIDDPVARGYIYRARLDGVLREYRVNSDASVTLLPLSTFVPTTTLTPWQNAFAHTVVADGTDAPLAGTLLELGEEITSTQQLPTSPWMVTLTNELNDAFKPLTLTPFWLDTLGSGFELQLVGAVSGTVIASFSFTLTTPPASDWRVGYYDSGDAVSPLKLTATVNEQTTEYYADATIGFGSRPPLRVSYVPGWLAVHGGAVLSEDDDVYLPPREFTDITFPTTLTEAVLLRVRPIAAGSIVSGMNVTASRQPGFASDPGPDGEILSQSGNVECDTETTCASIYPHYTRHARVAAVSCGSLSFTTADARSGSLCASTVTGYDPDATIVADDLNLFVADFTIQTVYEYGDPGTSADDTFATTETGTLTGNLTPAAAMPPPVASFDVEVNVVEDADDPDPEFVIVVATADVRAVGYSTQTGTLERTLSSSVDYLEVGEPVATYNGDGSFNTATVTHSVKLKTAHLGGPFLTNAASRYSYAKRVPRWSGPMPPIAFTPDDLTEIHFGETGSISLSGSAAYELFTVTTYPSAGWTQNTLWIRRTGTASAPVEWTVDDLSFTVEGV